MNFETGRTNGEKGTAAAMIDHIVGTHHAFTRSQLKKIGGLLAEAVHGDPAQTELLLSLKECHRMLLHDLTRHIEKEETELFPYVKELEMAVRSKAIPAVPKFISVKHPIRMFVTEHKETYNIIKKIRSLTDNYRLYTETDMSLRQVYTAMEALEKDLRVHMHYEDDRLFLLAAGLEDLLAVQAHRIL